jgi:hypothetical protein
MLFYFSACLLALAHHAAPVFCWLVLICYAPLIAEAATHLPSTKKITAWWLLFFLCHSFPLIQALFLSSCNFCLPSLVLPFLILVTALHAAGIFILSLRAFTALQITTPLAAATGALFCTLIFIDQGVFYWSGLLQGYGPAHPLVPLMAYASLRTAVLFCGSLGSLLLLLLSNLCIARAQKITTSLLPCSLTLLLLCTACFFLPPLQEPPLPISFACSALPFNPEKTRTAAELVDLLVAAVQDALLIHPNVHYLIFPESTFPLSVVHYPSSMARLQAALPEGVMLIFGGHVQKGGRLLSAIIQLTAQEITPLAYKKELLFFAETVPPLMRAFFSTHNGRLFSFPDSRDCQAESPEGWEYYLCSELFLGRQRRLKNKRLCLALVNDAWFAGTCYSKMLYRTAQHKALSFFDQETGKQVPLVYCSYISCQSSYLSLFVSER